MNYIDEKFADIQMLRYELTGFEQLTPQQKVYIYYLSQAALAGRDIAFDQFGRYNLMVRRVLERIFEHYTGPRDTEAFQQLVVYLKRIWFSSGIYHHYSYDKMEPRFSESFFTSLYEALPFSTLGFQTAHEKDATLPLLRRLLFDKTFMPKRVNKRDGVDLVRTSACNFYENLTQQEVEAYYAAEKKRTGNNRISHGLNTRLIKKDGEIVAQCYRAGEYYGDKISQIIHWLTLAKDCAENDQQRKVIALLIRYYQTGDLEVFNAYTIEWLKAQAGDVDFINGFIEVYADPLGLKGSWEGLVEYKNHEATQRTQLISQNAQWFEDHSPVDDAFKKKTVRGVTAQVICAAMLGGDEYPSTAIGINLPNADWIRAEYGSKSITISNITDAYNKASRHSGFMEEFVIDAPTLQLIRQYGDCCDNLHTDLHECLGHGSGQMLPTTPSNALKAYGNTIEEARADLFGLYYIADEKLVELGLTPNQEAYKSQYYAYMQNGLLTQCVRIKLGENIEEDHMRNRALIANWAVALDANHEVVDIVEHGNKHFIAIKDYAKLREIFAFQLKEIQRIKSEGDFEQARWLVEQYAIHIDKALHQEMLERYQRLNISPYKGFINPWMKPVYGETGQIVDITIDYTESYTHQMMRYSSEF